MNRLRKLRTEKGMTQNDLAKKLGVTRVTISFWESGTNRINSDTLIRLSDIFGCSIDFLCGK
ncbi:MAG: helix-turn-helix domain-containing protein [Schwartzia sp. (in: firmicutes)]